MNTEGELGEAPQVALSPQSDDICSLQVVRLSVGFLVVAGYTKGEKD